MHMYRVQSQHGKIHRNSARKHSSSGEVPKVPQKDTRPRKSSAVRRHSSTSDDQSTSSKGPNPLDSFPQPNWPAGITKLTLFLGIVHGGS